MPEKDNQEQDLKPALADTSKPEMYHLEELGGPFARGFAANSRGGKLEDIPAFRTAQRRARPRVMPVGPAKMYKGK